MIRDISSHFKLTGKYKSVCRMDAELLGRIAIIRIDRTQDENMRFIRVLDRIKYNSDLDLCEFPVEAVNKSGFIHRNFLAS